MLYFCCFICCFIARGCCGLAAQCDDSATELKGMLGQPFTFETVVLEQGSTSLALKRTIKNQRKPLMTYSRIPGESKSATDARYRYNEEKSSFENLRLQREDQGMYEIIITDDSKETFCKYDLKVYEAITNVMINLTHSLQNDSCVITMDCVPRTGDNITFSWTEDQRDLHAYNASLTVLVPKDNVSRNYSCRAENPVSWQSSQVNLMEICYKTPAVNVDILRLVYFLAGLSAALVMIVIAGLLLGRRLRQKIGKLHIHPQSHRQMLPPPDPAPEPTAAPINSVYAVVHKVGSTRWIEVTSGSETLETPTVYSYVQRKKSEENYSTVYELAGHITIEP